MFNDKFDKAGARNSVNYIWLCPRSAGQQADAYATALPLHYFERLYQNASKYPDTEFNLWMDFKQLTPKDRFFLASHQYIFEAQGINLRNLRKISLYARTRGFDTDSNIALYAKADYARILVLDHILRQNLNRFAVYADLDCVDVMIKDPCVTETLQTHGLVYGRAGRQPICNGYIALYGASGQRLMNEYLLPKTTTAFQKNLINHFGAFSRAIEKYRKDTLGPGKHLHWGLVQLPFMRTAMPYDENMYEGVCAKKDTRVPGSLDLI